MSIKALGRKRMITLLVLALVFPLLGTLFAQIPADETQSAGKPVEDRWPPRRNQLRDSPDPRGEAAVIHVEELPAAIVKKTTDQAAVGSAVRQGGDQGQRPTEEDADVASLERVEFKAIPLSDAMKLFSSETGLNVICSNEAGKVPVSVYLRDVQPLDALEAIVKANGLFFRQDDSSGIYRISTGNEYEKDLSTFREEQTRVFTLLYPNPVAVAQVIGQIFGDRVDLNMADADMEDLNDLSQRFNRFDLVDGRALGLGTLENGNRNGGNAALQQRGAGLLAGNQAMMAGGAGLLGGQGLPGGLAVRSRRRPEPASSTTSSDTKLSAAEIQDIENELARQGELSSQKKARLNRRGPATIYVSTIRRNNQIVVRTADRSSMEEIEELVKQLDVPTPTVLLEVKVLRIRLADGMNCAFEYFGGADGVAGGYSDGNQLPVFPGANAASRTLASGLGLSGSIPGSLTFQVVDANFRFRMQALESQSRVTALATPLILTANNEVSRIFVGDTLPFTVGFTPSQVVGGINAVNGAVSATPITELRDVGQSLLITPNINADRTVTLRVVEENSERVLGGASIPVPDATGAGVTTVQVDTVRRRTVSGTVVAQDGMAVALGGLIEESVSDSKDQIPVLGNLPGVGFLFRRQASQRSRSELVVVIRPYVFNTPSESAATTHAMLSELSVHPNSPDAAGTMTNYLPCEVVRSDPECRRRAKLLKFHNVRDVR